MLYTLRTVSGTLTPSYTHANGRGDVIAKTNGSGALTFQDQYDAFGHELATAGSTLDRQKSNSKDTDPTGLVDEGNRYRRGCVFLTRDPAGFIDGPNLYCYVNQNPWTKFDPEGLEQYSVGAWTAGGAAAGAGAGVIVASPTGEVASVVTVPVGALIGGVVGGTYAAVHNIADSMQGSKGSTSTPSASDTGSTTPAAPAKATTPGAKDAAGVAQDQGAAAPGKKDKPGVAPYETGTYGGLKGKSKPNDGLDIDHQPSKAAQIAAAEKAKGRALTPEEKKQVINEGTAVAVPEDPHKEGRTYAGKNTKAQIESDSADLAGAAKKDGEAMVDKASGANKEAAAKAAKEIQDANSKK